MYYAVYEDDVTNRARIHRTDKGCYIERRPDLLPDNRWHDGPYTLEEAKSVLQYLQKNDSDCCGNCMR